MSGHRPNRASLPLARQKMFLAALAFGAGILFATSASGYRPPLWWFIAALCFATAAILLRSTPRIQGTLALAALASLGALASQISISPSSSTDTALDGTELEIVAHVTRDAIERPGFFGGPRQLVELETETVILNGVSQSLSTGIRASLYQRTRRGGDEEADEPRQKQAGP